MIDYSRHLPANPHCEAGNPLSEKSLPVEKQYSVIYGNKWETHVYHQIIDI